MRWGSWGAKMSTQQYANTISKWLDCNVNEFDLANLYGDYSGEKEFGRAVKYLNISRSSLSFITKIGIENPSVARGNSVKHYNYSKKHIIYCVENSLSNLQTEYIDVLLLHRPSPLLQVEEVAEAVNALVSEGKIKSFGVSNFLPGQIDWLGKELKIEYNQISFSLSDFGVMENGNLEALAAHEMIVSAYSPISRLFETGSELCTLLNVLAEKHAVTPAAIGVAWVLKHPLISSVIIGTSQLKRIEEINRALTVDLSLEDYFKLWEAARGTRVP